jgi:hypothetical protein
MSASTARSWPHIRLYLEQLENRLLLNGSFAESGACSLVGDLMRLNRDLETSTLALVNAVQAAPANASPLVSLHDQWCRCWSLLTTD